jgi:hypothetical protein
MKKIHITTVMINRVIYLVAVIVTVTASCTFMYRAMIFDLNQVSLFCYLGAPLNLALYAGFIGLMTKERPIYTQSQIRYDRKIKSISNIKTSNPNHASNKTLRKEDSCKSIAGRPRENLA